MLGYEADELIGRPSHATWHHSRADGTPFPKEECPIHAGYLEGIVRRGADQLFWRKDGTYFLAEYVCTPLYRNGDLDGAVVVFQDITERKQAEAAITQSNAELAAQNAIAGTISRSLNLETILNTALETVLEVFQLDLGAIYLLDSDGETLTLQSARGITEAEIRESMRRFSLGEGISNPAVTEMRPVVLHASDDSKFPRHPFKGSAVQTLACTPLVAKGHAIGMLALAAHRPDAIPVRELALLASIGQQIGIAVENAFLYQEVARWADELALLHQATVYLTSSLDISTVLDQITHQAARLLTCEVAAIFLWDEENQEAICYSCHGMDGEAPLDLHLRPTENQVLADLVADRRSVAVSNALTDPRMSPQWRERFQVKAQLALPLLVSNKLLGVLFLIDQKSSRRWGPDQVGWAESFVNHASIALENAYLYERADQAAALEERQRIAAEMHDGLAQTLSYIGLRADQITEHVAAGRSEQANQELDQMREVIGRATQEARQIIASLQEPPKPRRSLQNWLAEVVSQFESDGDLTVELLAQLPTPLYLATEQAEQVLRVVQEAMLNAGRHAQASYLIVRLTQRRGHYYVSIEDNGKGFDTQAPMPDDGMGHFGLKIMRARAARIGGTVEIKSAPGEGTQVILTWPTEKRV